MSVNPRLQSALEAFIEAEKLELVDVEIVGAGNGRVLRLTVDGPNGLDLDVIADISHDLSRFLDEDESLMGDSRYSLEVSSPGLERPLRKPADFVKFVGTKLKVKTNPGVEGDRRFEATVVNATDVTDDSVTLTMFPTATPAVTRTLRYDQIEKAQTVFEWQASPKPGKTPSTRKKAST
jgi:ribosome maturation factor RimP